MYLLGIKLALQHLSQKKIARIFMLMSLSSLLLVCGYLAIVYNSISSALNYIGNLQTATVFIDTTYSEEKIPSVVTTLKRIQGVTSAQYVSRSEFLKKYRQMLPSAASILEAGDEEIVPRYIAIEMRTGNVADVQKSIKKIPGIESVELSTARHGSIIKALGGFRGLVVVLLSAVALALGSLVVNHYKSSTKGADQLKQAFLGLGARRTHLIVPFLVEGAIEGAAAGLISCVLFVVSAHLFQSYVNELSQAMGFLPAHYRIIPMALWLMSGGLFIGTMGSLWLSTKKR